MSGTRLALAALMFAALTAAPARSPAVSPKSVPYNYLHPEVFQVESGGAWEANGKQGHYRAVVLKRCSHEHCYDSLYLEWMVREGVDAALAVVKQVEEIGELSVISKLEFLPRAVEGKPAPKTGTRLQVTTRIESARKKQQLHCLRLAGPDSYTVSAGACPAAR